MIRKIDSYGVRRPKVSPWPAIPNDDERAKVTYGIYRRVLSAETNVLHVRLPNFGSEGGRAESQDPSG